MLTLLLSRCIKSPTDPGATVNATLDLQSGFAGLMITIEVEADTLIAAEMPYEVPLSGPLASEDAEIPRGTVHFRATTQVRPPANPIEVKVYSTTVQIGPAAKYYVFMDIVNEELDIQVRDEPFIYQ